MRCLHISDTYLRIYGWIASDGTHHPEGERICSLRKMNLRAILLFTLISFVLAAIDLRAEAPPGVATPQPKQTDLQKKKLGSTRPVHALGDILLAGQPQPEDFAILKQAGIKTIITLRKAQELPWNEADVAKQHGIKFVEVPFAGPDELKPEVFDQVLKILRDKKRGPTVLHCGSANRVGGIWYAYRVLDGKQSPQTALAEAKVVGLRTPGYLQKAQEYVARRAKQCEKQASAKEKE